MGVRPFKLGDCPPTPGIFQGNHLSEKVLLHDLSCLTEHLETILYRAGILLRQGRESCRRIPPLDRPKTPVTWARPDRQINMYHSMLLCGLLLDYRTRKMRSCTSIWRCRPEMTSGKCSHFLQTPKLAGQRPTSSIEINYIMCCMMSLCAECNT